MTRYFKALLLICMVMVLSACSNSNKSDTEKIAVIDWNKAVQGHTEYPRLVQGEKIVKNLIVRRDAQLELAKSQMNNLDNLRTLKQLSEQSYYEAELRTQLAERDQVNKARTYKRAALVKKQVEMELKPERQAIENEYRLRIFNLRLKKDSVVTNTRFRDRDKIPEMLASLDKQIAALKLERNARLEDLELSKQERIAEKLGPYVDELNKEMHAFASQKKQAHKELIAQQEGKYDKLMTIAPEALKNALAVMDKEIDKQQDKNKLLKQQINQDIEKIAVRLAKERDYSIVFNNFKVNVSAKDITEDIIAELKKNKK